MREKEILIDGLKIHYKIAGQGQPILVLHGWGGSSDSWTRFQEILAGQGFKVICPDFPGFGKSIPPIAPWGLGDFSNLISNFSKKLELESFFLLGHSFGGRIAIKFSIQYPEKIKSLILCDSAGIKPKPGLKTRIIFLTARIGNAIFTPRHLFRFKDSIRNLFYIFLRNKDYVKARGIMRESIKKVLAEDLLPDLSKIKTKTLIIWGEADRMVPKKYAYLFKEKVKGSKLEILPKIGHSPHLEAPKKLAEIISKFLSK